MALLLNIDTSQQHASVCLAENESAIEVLNNTTQKDHASWLLIAIRDLFRNNNLTLKDLDAVAVTGGPGSYTGLRVGMASAKGLCFALNIPLIVINTLKMMAFAAKNEPADLLCPMIDARRMEVFTALYDKSLKEIMPSINKILDSDSFSQYLENNKICFFGDGSTKFQALTTHKHAQFKSIEVTATHMVILSYSDFKEQKFADLAYSEPEYGKDFYTPPVKQSI
ncbi:MAG TPA: tRNA (adenosine(37)-N6)-threonylcarbamoyltransferase complex dimerization subunit type 1 TsaB [Flavisolibacter sp.]|jgi:tRNA threonylcarbamoyladenosine biosynthesis protein TsaB|nr:tRNA (adenosine(37)-N6)-threonylcarbamoyltransferase complex dimerization subunit type 1 TsaB [Flavisolibacter sp.]